MPYLSDDMVIQTAKLDGYLNDRGGLAMDQLVPRFFKIKTWLASGSSFNHLYRKTMCFNPSLNEYGHVRDREINHH